MILLINIGNDSKNIKMNWKKKFGLMFLFVALNATSFSQKSKQATSSVGEKINVTYSQVPLLKGVDYNQLFKLTVYVPDGKNIQYKSFQLQLNDAAVKSIEKINVIVRDERYRGFLEGADTMASVNNMSAALNVPVNIPLHQGWNTIWFIATIKSNADMDKKLLVNLKSITTGNGYVHSITPNINTATGKTGGLYRVGIAIRKAWEDSVDTYRIPGITTTDKGTLISVYDIRYKHSGDLPAN